MANLFSVKDKVVVITGGTGVLGKAIAAHLAEEGAKVILLGRKTDRCITQCGRRQYAGSYDLTYRRYL